MLKEEYFIALKASVKASEVIMDYYSQGFDIEIKADGSPVTQADLASSEIIETFLSQTSFPITSEEMEKIPFDIRKEWTDSWCVDPLDGTKEFVKKNGEFAVNIAHIQNNEPVFGLIASPVNQEIIFGGKAFGVFISSFDRISDPAKWTRIERKETLTKTLVIASSRTHNSGPVLNYINQLKPHFSEINYLKKGSSLKFFDLAQGFADTYPRYAPTMEWDIAPGQAILEALGGTVHHAIEMEPLKYNKENLTNPYFIANTQAFINHFA
ncbi:MAG: hypothetical protein RI922_1019 [Bacteroidota bacterium]